MQVQSMNNVNFQANRIMMVKKGVGETKNFVEAFKLNPNEDMTFVKDCQKLLNRKENLTSGQKKLHNFFKNFIEDAKEHTDDFFLFTKNGETIEGGIRTFSDAGDYILLEDAFTTNKDTLVKDSMFKVLLDEAKRFSTKDLKKNILGIQENNKTLNKGYGRLSAKDIPTKTKEIQHRNPDVSFANVNDEHINILDYLG